MTDSCPRPRPGCTCSFLPRTSAGRRPGSLPVMRKSMPASWPTLLDRQVAQHSRLAKARHGKVAPRSRRSSRRRRPRGPWHRSSSGTCPGAQRAAFRELPIIFFAQHAVGANLADSTPRAARGSVGASASRLDAVLERTQPLHSCMTCTPAPDAAGLQRGRRGAGSTCTPARHTPAAALRRPRDGSMGRESAASAAR